MKANLVQYGSEDSWSEESCPPVAPVIGSVTSSGGGGHGGGSVEVDPGRRNLTESEEDGVPDWVEGYFANRGGPNHCDRPPRNAAAGSDRGRREGRDQRRRHDVVADARCSMEPIAATVWDTDRGCDEDENMYGGDDDDDVSKWNGDPVTNGAPKKDSGWNTIYFGGDGGKGPFDAGYGECLDDEDVEANACVKNPKADQERPDISEALNERYKRQLRTFEKDRYGVPMPETARKFSYFASPLKIAEVCTGLGVYLVSLKAAVVLTFVLGILMIYPLVDDITTQNWSESYYLYTQVC